MGRGATGGVLWDCSPVPFPVVTASDTAMHVIASSEVVFPFTIYSSNLPGYFKLKLKQ